MSIKDYVALLKASPAVFMRTFLKNEISSPDDMFAKWASICLKAPGLKSSWIETITRKGE